MRVGPRVGTVVGAGDRNKARLPGSLLGAARVG